MIAKIVVFSSPHSYNLPQEYTKLISEYSRRSLDNERSRVWISKPIAQSQGRGIFLFRVIVLMKIITIYGS